MLTNPDNDAVECLSFADLYALDRPRVRGRRQLERRRRRWPPSSGSTPSSPTSTSTITGPGEESGTYDSFIEIALGDIAEARVEAGDITEDQVETTRPDYQASGRRQHHHRRASRAPTARLGWVGFAFAEEAGDAVKEPSRPSRGGECVAPTAETIADGSYPLSRSLYIYVNAAKAEENPAVAAYVDFYLDEA